MNPSDLPGRDVPFDSLPEVESERHEALVDLFGRYLMWLRRSNVASTRRLVEDPDERSKLGTIPRRPFEAAAALSASQRETAIVLAESCADRLMKSLLHLLTHEGSDLPLGEDRHVRFRLEIGIVADESDGIVERRVLNRGGRRCFYDYWGRWLNRFGARQTPGS